MRISPLWYVQKSGKQTAPSFRLSSVLQGSGWFKNALFKGVPAWKSTLILYAFRSGRSKQLRYQVCVILLVSVRLHASYAAC